MLSVAISLALLQIELPPQTVVENENSIYVWVIEGTVKGYDQRRIAQWHYKLSFHWRAGHGGEPTKSSLPIRYVNRVFWGFQP